MIPWFLGITMLVAGCSAGNMGEPDRPPQVDGGTPIKKVVCDHGFRYFSCNTEPVNNHPAMYPHGKGRGRVVVVGRGCSEEFPMTNFSDAVKRYEALLEKQGHRPK
jgi:hypothetical protein